VLYLGSLAVTPGVADSGSRSERRPGVLAVYLLHPDNGAAAAAQQQTAQLDHQQKAHVAAVAAGKTNIDSAFSQFTPDYYSGVTKAYENVYSPQLNDQYNTSREQLTALLAGNDTLGSSVGNNAQGHPISQLWRPSGMQGGNFHLPN
jgi:hypothetical protein